MIGFSELSRESIENLEETVKMLNKCRSRLDQVMYVYDRDMVKSDRDEFRKAYEHICNALDIIS